MSIDRISLRARLLLTALMPAISSGMVSISNPVWA